MFRNLAAEHLAKVQASDDPSTKQMHAAAAHAHAMWAVEMEKVALTIEHINETVVALAPPKAT